MNSVHCSKCVHLDGLNAEKHISLLVILCIIVYVTNNNKKKYIYISKPITDYGKMLKYRENIGKPIYQSISSKIIMKLHGILAD